MRTISVDIDLNDILYSMHKIEKQELVDELFREGYVPKKYRQEKEDYFGEGAETTLEKRILHLLHEIWYNRSNLNNTNIETLIFLSKK